MDEKGSTLIELLAVLAILSLLAAFALPRLAISDKAKVEAEAALLVSELRYLQEMTYSMQPRHEEFAGVEYDAPPMLVIDSSGKKYHFAIRTKRIHMHDMPSGMKISTNVNNYTFSYDGNAKPATFIIKHGNTFKYVIVDIAGRIRVSDTPPQS